MSQGITGTLIINSPLEQGLFQGRLRSNTSTSALLVPYNGRYVEVAEVLVDIGSNITINNSDNRIDSTGADAGAAMTTSTLYYIYISNHKATYAPSSLRASTVAPTLWNGSYYLGTTGNAVNWRFVGWIRTDGSSQFVDSDSSRHIVSYYNRRKARLFICPAYSNGNTVTTHTTNSTSWANANAGTGHQVSYISNGEDAVSFKLSARMLNSGANATYIGIQDNATAGAVVAGAANGTTREMSTLTFTITKSVGYYTAEIVVAVGGGTGTYEADFARQGATADPYATFLYGEVMV